MVKDAVGGTVMNEKTMQLEDVQMTIPMAFIRWKADSAREQAEEMKEETFSQMLMRLMDERGVIARDLYTEACIDRKLFSKIKKHEDYQPKKYTAICLALGLRLSLSETKKLLEATLKKSPAYNAIMECLSAHYYGMLKSECFERLDISQGTFSRAVDDLVKCGYVHESVDRYAKGHPLRLQLVDPFLLFHYHFLASDKAETNRFEDFKSDAGKYTNWRGHAFEILCMYHIDHIKKALGISGVRTNEYSWVSKKKEAQIDLIIERDDGIINICEEKYTDTPFTISAEYERRLLKKMDLYRTETKTQTTLKLVMICTEDITGKANIEHVTRVLTLDDLFN